MAAHLLTTRRRRHSHRQQPELKNRLFLAQVEPATAALAAAKAAAMWDRPGLPNKGIY